MKSLLASVLTLVVFGLAALVSSGSALAAPEDDYLYPAGSALSGRESVYYDSGADDYVFRFVGDETVEYHIDLGDPAVLDGVLRIYESTKDIYPVYHGGLMMTNSGGGYVFPDNVAITGQLNTHSIRGNTVTLNSQNTISGITVTKTINIELVGKALKVHAYTTDARNSYFRNHAGFCWTHSENAVNAKRIIIPYMDLMGTTMVDNSFFYQTFIDYTQSSASRAVKMAEPARYVGGSTSKFLNSVYTRNSRLSDDTVNTVDETGWVMVTSNAHDLFVMGDAPASPHRRSLDNAMAWNFSGISGSTDFVRYTNWMNAYHSYGMRDFKIYVWGPWANQDRWPKSLPPSGVGGTQRELQTMIDTAIDLDFNIGLYTYYYTLNANSAGYDANQATHDLTGAVKNSAFGGAAKASASDSALANNLYWETQIQNTLGINLAYEDTLSMHFPHNELLSEYKPDGHPSTLRENLINYKTMFDQSKNIHNGPYFGEGSLSPAYINVSFDSIYKGYVDGWERHLGDKASAPANNNDYFIVPDFELEVVKPYAVGLAFGFPQRFIAATLPHSDAVFDEVLATVISYGHIYYYTTNGRQTVNTTGEYARDQEHIKGYYMLCIDLQEQYMSSNIESVRYWDGSQYLDMTGALLAELNTRVAKIRLTYDNGLTIWINHDTSNWNVSAGGVNYTIPENGWVAYNSTSGFVEFSAIPAGRSSRFDYVYSPRFGFELIDGRGRSTTYGSITGTNLKVEWYNGFTVTEMRDHIDVVGSRPEMAVMGPATGTLTLLAMGLSVIALFLVRKRGKTA
ncbi:hypothetical protein ACFL1X_03545 [Candidatus Hydrogenedentota bacterium]